MDALEVRSLPEYSYVRLTRPFRTLPIGAEGTILIAYPKTRTYMVEFFAPERSVETVDVDMIESSASA